MQSPDDLDQLLARLREVSPPGDSDRVSLGFETRVLARVRVSRRNEGVTWFWRWSAVFGAAAVVCAFLIVQSYQALLDESVFALGGGDSVLSWLL